MVIPIPIALGGTTAALIGTVASIHWDKGTISDFRTEVNTEFGKLWRANERVLSSLDNLYRSHEKLYRSHEELRLNMHAINETLKKTLKAQEECAALQAAK